MKNTLRYYGPAILWALFILIICAIPLGSVGNSPMFFEGFDKLVHCGLFFVLSILYCAGSIRKWNTRSIRIEIAMKNTVVLISYGALIEVLQTRIFTWRSGDWNDLLADAIGGCMGVFGVLIISNALNHEKS
ncbi:VanZ family protein [Mucilaginibacter sp. RB4R14]|uniref:VanZ family protein n=1 Tax=Mucilaginibacter aurantiaciroseus TaxID=2949308 RepID=UPI0020909C5C|nr:VanZ family protein [Mucilaginibacter aurantiaciroseus]MCO5936540.1 VanZ family protein [Mucilaginibacter aurantiaciroseus]